MIKLGRRKRRQPQVNPFPVGRAVTGDDFCGRERQLAEIANAIRGGQNVVVVAPAGMGKSSIAAEEERRLRLEGVRTATIPVLEGDGDKQTLASVMATQIYRDIVPVPERLSLKLLTFLSRLSLRPEVTFTPEGKTTVTLSLGEGDAPKMDPDKVIRDVLGLPEQVATDTNQPVAVMWDDFDRIAELDPKLAASIRAIVERQRHAAHVILMRDGDTAERMLGPGGALEGFGPVIKLDPISAKEWKPFLRQKFEQSGTSISVGALASVIACSEGRPRDTIELCQQLWEDAQLGDHSVTVEMVQKEWAAMNRPVMSTSVSSGSMTAVPVPPPSRPTATVEGL